MESWWQRNSDLQIALSAREEFTQDLKEQFKRSQWEDCWQKARQGFRQSELEEFTKSKGTKKKLTKKQTKEFEDFLSERFEHSDWKDIEQAEATKLEGTMKKEFASAQWAKREQLELEQFEQDQKAKLERLTGRIPLLLETSKSGTEFHLDNDVFGEVFRLARKFVRDVRKQHNGDWDDYRTFTEGCLSGAYVDSSLLDEHLIDHRFFYKDKGIGHCVCDIVRRAVSSELLRSQAPFSASQFLASITDKNASEAGFMFETAVLRCIALAGLSIDKRLDKRMTEVVTFGSKVPIMTGLKFDQPVLYVPEAFNYPHINAIIALATEPDVEGSNGNVYLYPIQITIAKTHKDSPGGFFSKYSDWTEQLENYEIQSTFVWIKPQGAPQIDHPRDPTQGHPGYTECTLSLKDVHEQIAMAYERWKT